MYLSRYFELLQNRFLLYKKRNDLPNVVEHVEQILSKFVILSKC